MVKYFILLIAVIACDRRITVVDGNSDWCQYARGRIDGLIFAVNKTKDGHLGGTLIMESIQVMDRFNKDFDCEIDPYAIEDQIQPNEEIEEAK